MSARLAGVRAWGREGTAALVVALVASAVPVAAHVPVLRGKLVELVQRSTVIVIGTVEQVQPVDTRLTDTVVRLEQGVIGDPPRSALTFRGPTRFAPGGRYVFFLRRTDAGFAGVQEAGTIFPATSADDGLYRRTIEALQHALQLDAALRVAAVRAALIPALSAAAPPLRYHAALELSALAEDGHGPTDAERQTLGLLLADPATDPALRPLLSALAQPVSLH